MFARVYSSGIVGVDAYKIEVEVDCSGGIGQIHIVGLPDAAIKESQERVRSAIKACDFILPPGKKWIVNLAPADTRKEGPAYDLPIAIAILAATGYLVSNDINKFWLIGELGLDGSVRSVNGVVPVAMACENAGISDLIVPENNAQEAQLIEGLRVYPVSHLKQVVNLLLNPNRTSYLKANGREKLLACQKNNNSTADFADVKGQETAKRALTIAAAGKHNMLMVGPPGSGKSMLAQRLPGILPPLEFIEALELTKLYSVAGLLSNKASICSGRPFRSPHHSASINGLIGGGSHPKPGEISLSHHGVLFLDEMTEFPRSYLDALRQPLETGMVTISRASQTLSYPAAFLLIGACNPCPCGYRGDTYKLCVCTPYQADRYWSRLSGPLLDRIDLHIRVARLEENELSGENSSMPSEHYRLLVNAAVERQKQRFAEDKFVFNGQLNQAQVKKFCKVDTKTREMLVRAVTQLGLSARAYDRILKIARTIADLHDSADIQAIHVAEAISYRYLRKPKCA